MVAEIRVRQVIEEPRMMGIKSSQVHGRHISHDPELTQTALPSLCGLLGESMYLKIFWVIVTVPQWTSFRNNKLLLHSHSG